MNKYQFQGLRRDGFFGLPWAFSFLPPSTSAFVPAMKCSTSFRRVGRISRKLNCSMVNKYFGGVDWQFLWATQPVPTDEDQLKDWLVHMTDCMARRECIWGAELVWDLLSLTWINDEDHGSRAIEIPLTLSIFINVLKSIYCRTRTWCVSIWVRLKFVNWL